MNILITGAPGAGKGTVSSFIKERFNIPHISTGDMFRENIKNNTEVGKLAQQYMEQGKLVPDEVVIEMIKVRLAQDDCKGGYLIDGFPRTINQAEALEELVNKINCPIQLVINLNIDFDALLNRITGRRVCKKCGSVYHVVSNPSQIEGVCDACGGELYQRADDTEESLVTRLDSYKNNTAPILDFYRVHGLVVDVDVNRPINEVLKTIEEVLEGN